MADNLTLHMDQDRKYLVAEIDPVGIDTIGKVIKRSSISKIHIIDSILFGMVTKKNKRFTIIRSNLIPVMGHGVNLSCKLSNANLKMTSNIKGNFNSLILSKHPKRYQFTNGDCAMSVRKIDPIRLDKLLPESKNKFSRQTNKCKQIARAKGKSQFVDILIYDKQISMVYLPESKTFMSFIPVSTPELMGRIPDIRLRSYSFFHLTADEAVLEISFDEGVYWLRTEIQATEDIRIEEFEPLHRIK